MESQTIFTIQIKQKATHVYEIEAETLEEARVKAEERWYKEDCKSSEYWQPLQLKTLKIESEFDPSSPKLENNQDRISLAGLMNDIKFNQIIYTPYKPKWKLTWNKTQKSKLIEAFLINSSVDPIIIYKIGKKHYQVINGMETLQTIVDFFDDRFALIRLAVRKSLNGRTYSTLDRKDSDLLDRCKLKTTEIIPVKPWNSKETEKLIALAYEYLRQ
jgi:hypothetical protein